MPLYPSDSACELPVLHWITFIFSIISFVRYKNNNMNNYRIVDRIHHGVFCDQDIYHNPQWSRCGCSVLIVLVRNSFHEWLCRCPLPRGISNKFPDHHCHTDAAKEGNMLNFQSVPKIKPCLIVLQRKAIVCPQDALWSQGPSWSLKTYTCSPSEPGCVVGGMDTTIYADVF